MEVPRRVTRKNIDTQLSLTATCQAYCLQGQARGLRMTTHALQLATVVDCRGVLASATRAPRSSCGK